MSNRCIRVETDHQPIGIELEGQFARTELVLGKEGLVILSKSRVAVFGIGGVGGFAVEALVRSGIGAIDLIDKDTIDVSNLNRQIIALHSTLGKNKVEAMKERILDINPKLQVFTHKVFYLPETADDLDLSSFDYIIDAMDTVTAKVELILRARKMGVPVISSMGTGNKLDPTKLEVSRIDQTKQCPLAKVMRKELRQRGIEDLKVVYSPEEPVGRKEKNLPGSVSFVPPVAGLILAAEVVKDLIGRNKQGIIDKTSLSQRDCEEDGWTI